MIKYRRIFFLKISIIISLLVFGYTFLQVDKTKIITKIEKEKQKLKKKNKNNKQELKKIRQQIKDLNKKNLDNLKYIILKKDIDLVKNIFINIVRYSNQINIFKISNLKIDKDNYFINVIKVEFKFKSSYDLLNNKEAFNLFKEMLEKYIEIENIKINKNEVSFYITKTTIKGIKH